MDRGYQALFENFEAILSGLPCNIYWKDVNCVYMGCNNRLAETLGLSSPSEIAGKTDFNFGWEKELAQSFINLDQRVMKEKTSLETFDTFAEADGRIVTVLTNKNPLFDEGGNVIGVLATSTDVTELKETQEKLKNTLAELEVTLEKAKIAEKAKDAILSNYRHDFLTSLTGNEMLSFCIDEMKQGEPVTIEDLQDVYDSTHNFHEHAKQIMHVIIARHLA